MQSWMSTHRDDVPVRRRFIGTDWEEPNVTDGSHWRQPDGTAYPVYPPASAPTGLSGGGTGTSPWWSDALRDPWRDPYAPTALVVPGPDPAPESLPEPVADPGSARGRGLTPVLVICVVTALLAGALGGALGYTFAARSHSPAIGQPSGAAPAVAHRPPDSLPGVAERVLPSVVTVRVSGGGGTSVGSGFVVSADGYVITNDHVVGAGSSRATVDFSDGTSASAKVVGQDPESDLAVIKVARSGLAPVEFGDSEAIKVGDWVLAFGSPLALANTVTAGIISAVDRTIQAGEPGGQLRYYAAIQTDAAVNQGNSGGPLVDASGRVIGVNSVIRSVAAEEEEAGNIGLAFAIPINQAKRITQDIIDTGKARRTVIGARVGDAGNGAGVRLAAVHPNGPAATGGLKAGDVVLRLDGRPLTEASDLIALVRKYAPGAVVTVEYRRGGNKRTASVTLAADVK